VFLTVAFKQASSSRWMQRLLAADVAAAQPISIETLRDQNSRAADGTVGIDRGSFAFSIYADHPSGHQVTQIDHYAIRPTNASIKAVKPTEAHGRSTREVLASVGYSKAEIEEMLELGVAGLGWGKTFLPADSLGELITVSTTVPGAADAAALDWVDIESNDGDMFIS
jgi:crotonobetainyl-CoA:carnitine CoA-transferase CaiB-like acyl-CoA transferase